MFFNKEDVAWYKALQLWTKRGRSGFIKESKLFVNIGFSKITDVF